MVTHQISFDRPLRQVTLVTNQAAQAPGSPATHNVADQRSNHQLLEQAVDPKHETVVALLDNIESSVAAMQSRATATREQLLQTTVALSRMVVSRLIGETAELQQQRLLALVTDAMKRSDDTIDLHLNQADMTTIQQQLASRQQLQQVKLIADNAIPVGECRVSLDGYDLVSNLEQQLDDIDAMLRELIHEH